MKKLIFLKFYVLMSQMKRVLILSNIQLIKKMYFLYRSKNKFRRGFIGNLTIIINQIIAKQENCPIIKRGIEKSKNYKNIEKNLKFLK